jgi:glycosyltransferase involved in cell wall biosynthesis
MRIGIASECPWVPSSFGKIVFNLSRGLKEEGFDVTVFCPTSPSPTLFSRRFFYVPDCDIKDLCVSTAVHTQGYTDFTNEKDLDVVIVFGTPYGNVEINALSLCERFDKPCVGYFVTESMRIPPYMSAWVEKVSFFATPTETVRRIFIESLSRLGEEWMRNVSERSMRAVHGIDLNLFSRENCEKVCEYTTWGGKSSEYKEHVEKLRREGYMIISFLAKNNPRKDIYALLRAVKILLDNKINVALFAMMIDAVSSEVWRDLVSTAHLAELTDEEINRILFMPDDTSRTKGLTEYSVLKILCLSDIFAYPTQGEAFGIPVVEAGAVGTAVATTDIPVMREVLEEYDDQTFTKCYEDAYPPGYVLCNPYPEDLARSLLYVYDHREKLEKKIVEITRRYDYKRMTKEMIKAVEKGIELFRENRRNKWFETKR